MRPLQVVWGWVGGGGVEFVSGWVGSYSYFIISYMYHAVAGTHFKAF